MLGMGKEGEADYTNEQENFIRFQYELEFVQMLTNCEYLKGIFSGELF